MQDWANLIREIALLFSVFVAGLTAWNALRKTSHEVSKDDKEELRADRDLYRNRWLESEKAFDEIVDRFYTVINPQMQSYIKLKKRAVQVRISC